MTMEERYGIAAFRSRQQVLRFDAALRRGGIATRIVSTPRNVALGCGLSVSFAPEDARTVVDAVNRMRPENLIGVYMVERSGGRTKLTTLRL